jgi:hypothetical protein
VFQSTQIAKLQLHQKYLKPNPQQKVSEKFSSLILSEIPTQDYLESFAQKEYNPDLKVVDVKYKNF